MQLSKLMVNLGRVHVIIYKFYLKKKRTINKYCTLVSDMHVEII